MIRKPSFFVVGTPKGGTTSIFNYLEEHPEVFLPKLKEPHFFSSPEILDTYYNVKIITEETHYRNLFKDASTQNAIGDLSTSYLYNRKSAERIKSFNSDSKIIIVLRNPVERAISHYLMDYNLGYIDIPFIDVINNREKNSIFYREYIELGYYESQISNYYEIYDKSKVLIILSEDLFSNTIEIVSDIYKFIGVDENYIPDISKKHNQYRKPKFEIVKKIAQSKVATNLLNNIPEEIKNIAKTVFYSNTRKPLLTKERDVLKDLYRGSIIKTSNLINRDLSSWI